MAVLGLCCFVQAFSSCRERGVLFISVHRLLIVASYCRAWALGSIVVAAPAAAKSLQLCPTLCNPIDGSPPGSPVPGILQAKNTGVGCHFLLQCMKVKSESEVAQSYPTLSDPMDYSPPGSSPWDFPGKSTGVGCHCLLHNSCGA